MQLNDYREDAAKQEKGSPCYLGEGYFNVQRIHTPEYNKQIEEIKAELYGFAPKDRDNERSVAHWLCEFGVTSWGDIFDGDDPLDYSKRNARKVFLNPEYRKSLNSLLIQHASDYNNYLHDKLEKDIEAVKKN